MRITRQSNRFLLAAAALCLAAMAVSCGEEPKSRDEVFADQLELPAVYITEKTHKQFNAPTGKGPHLDEDSGEFAWPAMACHAPDCPGKGEDGQPHLFFVPISGIPGSTAAAPPSNGYCPRCYEAYNLGNTTPEQKKRYGAYVRLHVMPETAARMKELEAQRREIDNRKGGR